tara:strand:+ start:135 stop:1277 length:1143 start_codon:yes stop_codon:yes gene_type:complete
MDLVSRADAMIAASNLRKILAGAPGISTGVLGGTGKVSTQREINALVPDGYIAVVNSDTRGYTRMPNPTFSMAVGQSSMGKGQKTAILRKAQGKDKEVFTKNKQMISAVRKPVKVKKTNQQIETDNLSKGYIGGGSQMGRVNTSGGIPTKDMTGAKVPAQSVKQIREDMKKIKSKSGHDDSPVSMSGVKWKKNDKDEYEAVVNGESYFYQRVEKKWRYYDDDMREYSLPKFKKLIEKQQETKSTDTMVGYNPSDKKEVEKAKTKLAPSIYRSFMSELDGAVKSQGLANAKKQSKDKTKYMLFLNAGNLTAKSLNDKVNLINVLYREGKVSEAEMGELTRKFRRYQTTRKNIQGLTKGIYDNMDDFKFHQSKAGVNLSATK